MKVKVAAFSVSIDGFSAGPRQDLNNPLGVRGTELLQWFFPTEAFNKMHEKYGTDGTFTFLNAALSARRNQLRRL